MKESFSFDKERLRHFLSKNFPDHHVYHRSSGREAEFVCPFCKGGRDSEISFNLNIDEGVARCWRAKNCDWKGSLLRFVKEYLDTDWETASNIILKDKPETKSELVARLNNIEKAFEIKEDKIEFNKKIDRWVESAVPIKESDLKNKISNWLLNERGYDPIIFSQQHNLFVPPQIGKFEGRVLFEVRTNENRAYLAYDFTGEHEFKTLNPRGKVLSNMLYNFNNIQDAKVVLVTEGIFDTARLKLYDFHPVSLFGANMSWEQAGLLSELNSREIVFCLDYGMEKKSISNIKRLSSICNNKKLSFINIKQQGADPDDLNCDEFLNYFTKRKILKNRSLSSLKNKLNEIN